MRHQVDLAEPGIAPIPTVGLHRNGVLPQYARLGAPVNTPFALALLRLQSPVDLPSTDAQQLFLHLRRHPVALANPGHPVGQQCLPPHRPGISRGFPDRRQDGEHLLAIARPPSARPPRRLFSRGRSIQKPNRTAQLCGNVRRPPGNIPTSPCAPICPPQKSSLSRVTSYVSRRHPLRLHLAWLDTQCPSICANPKASKNPLAAAHPLVPKMCSV